MDIKQKAIWVADIREMSQYWRGRHVGRLVESEKMGQQAIKKTLPIYDKALRTLNKQINDLYTRYSTEAGLDVLELTRVLSGVDRNKFIRNMHQTLKSLGLGVGDIYNKQFLQKLTGLEAMKQQVYWEIEKLAKEVEPIQTSTYKEIIKKSYEETGQDIRRLAGDTSTPFQTITVQVLDEMLKERWAGGNYSHRIWGNTSRLAKNLMNTLGTGLMIGTSQQKMANDIGTRFDANQYELMRLVRTEANYFNNMAELQSYRDEGIDYYRYDAVLDGRTSQWCDPAQGGLGGMIFKVSDAMVGVNYPPLHPHCRSTTYPLYKGEIGSEKVWTSKDVLAGNHIIPTVAPPKKPKPKAQPIRQPSTSAPVQFGGLERVDDFDDYKHYVSSLIPEKDINRKTVEMVKKMIAESKNPEDLYSVVVDKNNINQVIGGTSDFLIAYQEMRVLPRVYAVGRNDYEKWDKESKAQFSSWIEWAIKQNMAVDMRTQWHSISYGGQRPELEIKSYGELGTSLAKEILSPSEYKLIVDTAKSGMDYFAPNNPAKQLASDMANANERDNNSDIVSYLYEYTLRKKGLKGYELENAEATFFVGMMTNKNAREKVFFSEGLPKDYWHFSNKVDVNTLNKILRKGYDKSKEGLYTEKQFNELVGIYDKAFENSKTLEDMKVWRGVAFDDKFTIDKFKIGSVFNDNSYLFTTERFELAQSYMRGSGKNKEAMLEIFLPKGTKAMTYNQFYYEPDQILLARDTKFLVKRIYNSEKGYPIIQLEAVMPKKTDLEMRFYDMFRYDKMDVQPVKPKGWGEMVEDIAKSMLTKEQLELIEKNYRGITENRDFSDRDWKANPLWDEIFNVPTTTEGYFEDMGMLMKSYAEYLDYRDKSKGSELAEMQYKGHIEDVLEQMWVTDSLRNKFFGDVKLPMDMWHHETIDLNEVNAFLRGGREGQLKYIEHKYGRGAKGMTTPVEKIKTITRTYDDAFEKSKTKQDTTFFRGVAFDDNFTLEDNFKVGSKYTDNSYMFAKPTDDGILSFMKMSGARDKEYAIMEIVTPKGTRVMGGTQFFNPDSVIPFDASQVLFGKGTEFMVIDVKKDQKDKSGDVYTHIKVQAIPKDTPQDYVQKLSNNVKGFNEPMKEQERFGELNERLSKLVELHEIERLQKEAKKYKSADEFVDSVFEKANKDIGDMFRRDEGVSIDDITKIEKIDELGERPHMPSDFYNNPNININYNNDDEREVFTILEKVREKPNELITVYGLHGDYKDPQLTFGSSVTLSKGWAKNQSSQGFVREYQVQVRDIKFAGDTILEMGYYPRERLKELWKHKNDPVVVATKLLKESGDAKAKDGEFGVAQGSDYKTLLQKVTKSRTAESFARKELADIDTGDYKTKDLDAMKPIVKLTKGSLKEIARETGIEVEEYKYKQISDLVENYKNKPLAEVEVFLPSADTKLKYGEWVHTVKHEADSVSGIRNAGSFRVKVRDLRLDNFMHVYYYPKESLKDVWERTQGKQKLQESTVIAKPILQDKWGGRYKIPLDKDVGMFLARKGITFKPIDPTEGYQGTYESATRNIDLKVVDMRQGITRDDLKEVLGEKYKETLSRADLWTTMSTGQVLGKIDYKNLSPKQRDILFSKIDQERLQSSLYHEVGHLVDLQNYKVERTDERWYDGSEKTDMWGQAYSQTPEWAEMRMQVLKKAVDTGNNEFENILVSRMKEAFEYNFITNAKKGQELKEIDEGIIRKIAQGKFDKVDTEKKLQQLYAPMKNGGKFLLPTMKEWREDYAEKDIEMFADAFSMYMQNPKKLEKDAPLIYNHIDNIWQKTKQETKEWSMYILK